MTTEENPTPEAIAIGSETVSDPFGDHHRQVIDVLDKVLIRLERVQIWMQHVHRRHERRRDVDEAIVLLRGMQDLHRNALETGD